MCRVVKHGIWKTSQPAAGAVNALLAGGYGPLTALVLAARGIDGPRQAKTYLCTECPLPSPFLLPDMARAAERVQQAIARGERIAVYGDYDVDGITATCLLTDFLRRLGASCIYYIPGRLEEGYGLNTAAIEALARQEVGLIITVDCGITASAEAELCRRLGIDLVITDHHACKEQLPQAVAVVDPHRPDSRYPHKDLSGVGVAFKLAAALDGDQKRILSRYADMVCLGTVADVMTLRGENRTFVAQGLASLRETRRPGLRRLMQEAGCDPRTLNAGSIGFVLAPRINAAGRMGNIEPAVELFLTEQEDRAAWAARELCQMNRRRQAVEAEIYRQAIDMLPPGQPPAAIVLSSESWHQGVVGIVASKMAEEFCCPTFLICLDGDRGKASSRSYGGFNLFACLTQLSPLLENYGGHELAAGFTIAREQIDSFRREICRMAGTFYEDTGAQSVLEIDCAITPDLLTTANVEALDELEPCGAGAPRPVFLLEGMMLERMIPVGAGRHLRLRFRAGKQLVSAIAFSTAPAELQAVEGERVDLACTLQINEFRGVRSVQVNVIDLRPACQCECSADLEPYRQLRQGAVSREAASSLLPARSRLADVWRYLAACPKQPVTESPECLCRKIVRATGRPMGVSQLLVCLDIFREAGLVRVERQRKQYVIHLTPGAGKADLNQSPTMRLLRREREEQSDGNL